MRLWRPAVRGTGVVPPVPAGVKGGVPSGCFAPLTPSGPGGAWEGCDGRRDATCMLRASRMAGKR